MQLHISSHSIPFEVRVPFFHFSLLDFHCVPVAPPILHLTLPSPHVTRRRKVHPHSNLRGGVETGVGWQTKTCSHSFPFPPCPSLAFPTLRTSFLAFPSPLHPCSFSCPLFLLIFHVYHYFLGRFMFELSCFTFCRVPTPSFSFLRFPPVSLVVQFSLFEKEVANCALFFNLLHPCPILPKAWYSLSLFPCSLFPCQSIPVSTIPTRFIDSPPSPAPCPSGLVPSKIVRAVVRASMLSVSIPVPAPQAPVSALVAVVLFSFLLLPPPSVSLLLPTIRLWVAQNLLANRSFSSSGCSTMVNRRTREFFCEAHVP